MSRVLDQIDEQIIQYLQRDGRATNREIARSIGVSEGTVRNRIERLTREEIIRLTAIVNPAKVGLRTTAVISLQVEPQHLTEVASRLATAGDLVYIGYATGTSDVLCLGQFADNDALFRFLTEFVANVPGVREVNTSIILRTVRRLFTSTDLGPAREDEALPAAPAGS